MLLYLFLPPLSICFRLVTSYHNNLPLTPAENKNVALYKPLPRD